MGKGTDLAPSGQIWVCAACGKTSRSRYGFDGKNRSTSAMGWDAACMLNAVLCHDPKGADGKWYPVDDERAAGGRGGAK